MKCDMIPRGEEIGCSGSEGGAPFFSRPAKESRQYLSVVVEMKLAVACIRGNVWRVFDSAERTGRETDRLTDWLAG